MYTIGNIVYAKPGYLLRGKNRIGYQLTGVESDFTEELIKTDDMTLQGNLIKFNNGLMRLLVEKTTTYADLKAKFVKMRYSNDDQIAILLNKDENEAGLDKYNKMQEWREWSGTLAKLIISKINE